MSRITKMSDAEFITKYEHIINNNNTNVKSSMESLLIELGPRWVAVNKDYDADEVLHHTYEYLSLTDGEDWTLDQLLEEYETEDAYVV